MTAGAGHPTSDFKILIKQKFDARTSYDKDNERHPTLAAQLVKRSNLRLGWQVLDLACGSGLVTYLAAADVGSAGFVTGMDLSTGLLQQAEAKRASSGLNNIKFLEGDIEHADFPSKSFDAILCSSAIFYFDMPSTVKRLHTWLKPGGLLAYNTLQVEATPGLLLEKTTPLNTYVDKGWQMVATGFKPFFPSLANMSVSEQAALKEQFCAQATVIGKGMINQQGLVEDRHINLWITASTAV
ncbi:TPA: hypothetical protein ACH3X3_014092 [Trebouxia sp. C0006]